jgi:acetoin utilization deacetylase AcuC-like enzyme
MTVGIVAHPRYSLHLTGEGHPEQPARESVIREALNKAGYLNNKTMILPRDALMEELFLCHTKEYVELAQKEIAAIKNGVRQLSTGDVQISPLSYETALLAAGGVLAGVDAIMEKKFKRVFCIVRPPGHHACGNKGMGFCLFNNVAIAARYCQKKYGLGKILIVDWDVHHGNGTEEIFAKDKSVFYFSTHQYGIYPGTGDKDYDGEKEGKGTTLNVPIRKGTKSRERVLEAFEGPLVEAMKSFKPEFVIISCGFDGHELDPLGAFNLKTSDFGRLTSDMVELAEEYCDGKVISVLEGGYDLEALKEASVEHVKRMS